MTSRMRTNVLGWMTLILCGAASLAFAADPLTVDVQTVGFSFAPAVIVVPAGTVVRWNGDIAHTLPHSVTTAATFDDANAGKPNAGSGPDTFDQPLGPGAIVSHRFDNAGTFSYFCKPHHALGMVGQVVVVGSSSAPVSGDEISAVWHDGVIFNTLAYANDGQDPVKCRQHQNHHTHAGAPGEGLDVSGWCDALVFRQKTFTVPAKTTSGRAVKSAALNVQLRFASGDEPPTDQLPREESKRGTCDAEVTVADAAGAAVGSSMGGDNVMFQSPHRLSVPVTPGKTYTITVDPFAGPHIEWHVDADLALSTQ